MCQGFGACNAVHHLPWPRQIAVEPAREQDAIGLAFVGGSCFGAIGVGRVDDIANGLSFFNLGTRFDMEHQETRASAVTHVHAADGGGW